MLKDFEIALIVIAIFFTPIICSICHRSLKINMIMRHIKLNNIKIKPINYQVIIDKNKREQKKMDEIINIECV